MIDNITSQEIRALAETTAQHCVSVFLPTHRAGVDQAQDPVRLRNLLATAATDLTALGLRAPEANAILRPASALLDEQEFWAHQDLALALYLTETAMTTYRLPDPVDELVVTADRFHIKPLLAAVTAGRSFFVLVLGRHRARLLRGSRSHVTEVALSGVPERLHRLLGRDAGERQLQLHSAGRFGQGRVTATFHGHGGPRESTKDDLARFFTAVDDGINHIITDRSTPLVLAGPDHLLANFRHSSTYPRFVEHNIEGDSDRLAPEELFARAWPLVEPVFEQDRAAATATYLEGAAPQTSSLIDTVLAASSGRIETLFVPTNTQQWGTFAREEHRVEVHDEREPGDRDLLDVAAIDTILNGGVVFTSTPEEVPGDGPLAAILRY